LEKVWPEEGGRISVMIFWTVAVAGLAMMQGDFCGIWAMKAALDS
jgi:hypothetical protein